MEDLFNVIGKLYIDVYNSQKVIELLRAKLEDKEKELEEIRSIQAKDE